MVLFMRKDLLPRPTAPPQSPNKRNADGQPAAQAGDTEMVKPMAPVIPYTAVLVNGTYCCPVTPHGFMTNIDGTIITIGGTPIGPAPSPARR